MKFYYFIILLLASACMDKSAESNYDFEESQTAKTSSYDETQAPIKEETETLTADLKIIRTADLRIKVKTVKTSTAKIETLIKNNRAYVANSSFSNTAYQLQNDITIRVPSENFEPLLDAITKEAIYINYKNINAKDVSEEYLDIETRLRTKKEVRDRYEEILRTKAKTVKEVLAAEEAIRVIQEEIESREGRLRYLKNQVQYSSINLSLYEEVEYQDAPHSVTETYASKLFRSLKKGWNLILELVLGFVTIWPLLIIGGLLYWKRKAIFGRKEKHSNVKKD